MPRFVRPSWIEVECDGVKKHLGTGPTGIQPDNSHLWVNFKVREHGGISESISVSSRVVPSKDKPGQYLNRLEVRDPGGDLIYTQETEI